MSGSNQFSGMIELGKDFTMIQASNVTLRLGKKALFEDVNIKFTEGNCYGLIGANGAGKSTFLKILTGEIEPTKGDIIITPGQRLSFLKQDHFQYDEFVVLDTVIMGNERLYAIMKEKDEIYAKEDFTEEDGIKASELEAEFANIVFVCAGPAVLDKPGKFDYTAIRKALCLQTTSSLPD